MVMIKVTLSEDCTMFFSFSEFNVSPKVKSFGDFSNFNGAGRPQSYTWVGPLTIRMLAK